MNVDWIVTIYHVLQRYFLRFELDGTSNNTPTMLRGVLLDSGESWSPDALDTEPIVTVKMVTPATEVATVTSFQVRATGVLEVKPEISSDGVNYEAVPQELIVSGATFYYSYIT